MRLIPVLLVSRLKVCGYQDELAGDVDHRGQPLQPFTLFTLQRVL